MFPGTFILAHYKSRKDLYIGNLGYIPPKIANLACVVVYFPIFKSMKVSFSQGHTLKE
jgi:hypothetical protein